MVDIDENRTVYIRRCNGHAPGKNFHIDEGCQGLQVSNGYAEYEHGELQRKHPDAELCDYCNPDIDLTEQSDYTSGKKSRLEEALEAGDVPDELTQVNI